METSNDTDPQSLSQLISDLETSDFKTNVTSNKLIDIIVTDEERESKAEGPACLTCKLFDRHLQGTNMSYNIETLFDTRKETKSDGTILVVYKAPTEHEDKAGVVMTGNSGMDLLQVYLPNLDNKWAVTNAVKCYSGKTKGGVKDVVLTDAEQRNCSDYFLGNLIKNINPKVIVCLGVPAMKAVLKEHAPKTLNKAVGDPIKMKELDYFVLVTQDPAMHQNGRKDLFNEYFRVFNMADKLASGDFHEEHVEYELITSPQRAFELAETLQEKIFLDIEDNHNSKDKVMKTVWHPGVKIILLQITEKVGDRYQTYVFVPEVLSSRLFIKICSNRVIVGHNIKYDIQCIFAVYGVDVYLYLKDYVCTFLKFVSIDQGRIGNGLKPLSVMYFNINAYDTILWQEIDRSNKAISDSHALVRTSINELEKLLELATKASQKKEVEEVKAPKVDVGFVTIKGVVYDLEFYTKAGKERKRAEKKPEPVYDIEAIKAQLSDLYEQQDELRPLGSANFSDTNKNTLYLYGAHDTHFTGRLEEEILSDLEKEKAWNPLAYEISKKNIYTFSHVERWGLPINMKRHQIVSDAIDEKVKNIKNFLISNDYVQRALAGVPEIIKQCEVSKKYPEGKLTYEYLFDEAIKPNKKKFLGQLLVETDMLKNLTFKTKGGDYKLDEDVLEDISGGEDDCEDQFKKASWTPFSQKSEVQVVWYLVYKYRKFLDIQRKFMRSLKVFEVNGRLHPDFILAKSDMGSRSGGAERSGGTVTGRLCIAKGSMIETPRDLIKNPKGIPIEDIKVGDYVYSYDDHGELHLKKVLWSGKTGSKDTIQINWKGSGHKGNTGSLCLTPEHQVRMLDGSWKPAGSLKPKDRVMALSRGLTAYGYHRMYARTGKEIREHVFIANKLIGDPKGKHVHHIDENKLNNSVSNLQILTAIDHNKIHYDFERCSRVAKAHLNKPEVREKARKVVYALYGGGKGMPSKQIGRYTLLKAFAKHSGRLWHTRHYLGIDYETIIARCKYHNIDLVAMRLRYDTDNKFISRGRLARVMQATNKVTEQRKLLRTTSAKFKNLCSLMGIIRNHEVVSVTSGVYVDVYDLEIEDTHCFIANELAVHNSTRDPNLLALSKDKALRWLFVAEMVGNTI